jgi:hypothetical protein
LKWGYEFDPKLQFADSLNVYEYANSKPTIEKDPLGLYIGAHKRRLRRCLSDSDESCKGKCGPDVTRSFYQMVTDVKRKLHDEFQQYPSSKDRVCGPDGIMSSTGWDIVEAWSPPYAPGPYPSGKYCDNMVTLNNKCVNIWELNYYLWGLLNRICGHKKEDTLLLAWSWSVSRPDDPVCKYKFASAGYDGGGAIAGPLSDCDMSACCSTKNVPRHPTPLHACVQSSKCLGHNCGNRQ